MSYDEKVLRSEYAFSGLEVLLCDMFRRSRAWVWPELFRFTRGRSVVVAGHLNLYRERVDQRDLLPQRVSSRECGSAMAACVTQFRFVSNNNESTDLTAPLFPKTKHVCPARRSGTQAHVRWRFGTGISYQVWCLCLNAPPAPRAKEEAHPTSYANGSVLCVNAGNGERHIDPASACSSCRWPLYRSGPTGLLEDELAQSWGRSRPQP